MALLDPAVQSPEALLAQSPAKLWPHREHESNCWKNLMCWFGPHRWAQLDLRDQARGREVRFCRGCSKISIDGILHGG